MDDPSSSTPTDPDAASAPARTHKLERSIVLVGLMGAGKSTVGRRLANRLGLPFVDADSEIEAAAGCTIQEIFERHGEAAFRDGERKVIARLLDGPVQVLATGGGAFVDGENRARIKESAISVWLKAELDTLLKRCMKRNSRPLLKQGDPREILDRLMRERAPYYAQADIIVDSGDGPHEIVVEKIIASLDRYLSSPAQAAENAAKGACS